MIGNLNITCNYCGKPQCVVVPYNITDMHTAAKNFLEAVISLNESPFDLHTVREYNSAKKQFVDVFGLSPTWAAIENRMTGRNIEGKTTP